MKFTSAVLATLAVEAAAFTKSEEKEEVECFNLDLLTGATSAFGDSCEDYWNHPSWCTALHGRDNDDDWNNAGCCACGGGSPVYPACTVYPCENDGVCEEEHTLSATLGAYPGYEGDIAASGQVRVSEMADMDVLVFEWNLKDLEVSAMGGIHIHSGMSCDTIDGPEGHYWAEGEDPWNFVKYGSDEFGSASSGEYVQSGYTLKENKGRVVVAHDSNGARILCGVLTQTASASCKCPLGFEGDRCEIELTEEPTDAPTEVPPPTESLTEDPTVEPPTVTESE